MTTGVTVDFNANLARFTSAIDKATNDLNKFQSNAQRISGNIKGSFAALGVGLSVTGFVAFIKGAADAQDKLLDLSKATRLTVTELAGLSVLGKKSGSNVDDLANSINKLAQNMGKDIEKFRALGITAKDPLEAFGQLADVMNAIDDPQKRAAVGAEALGKAWAGAAPAMTEGSEAIKKIIKDGAALSKVTEASAKAADEFNDKWEDLTTTLSGWGIAIANPVIGGIMKIGKALELEINRKPGSIADFLLGPKQGFTGELDQYGLPKKQGAAAAPEAKAGKPSATALDKFIGGKSGSGKAALSDLDKALAEQKKRIAELNSGFDEQLLSVDTVSRQYDKILEDRASAMDDLHTQRMEMYRIETEGEEAVRENLQKTTAAIDEMSQFAVEAASNMQDAMADGFFDIMQGKFDNLGSTFKATLDRMVANALAAQIGEKLFGDFGKTGNVGGLALDALKFFKVPGFAEGTPYVPRTGLAMIHQGERIIPADQNRAGFGGNIIIHVNGAGNAQDVRRAAGQGAREALAAFSGAQRYA